MALLRPLPLAAAVLHHAFWYETTRNYLWPDEFTALFDYELRWAGGM